MPNNTITPDKFIRRSFLYRKFDEPQTTWEEVNGYAIVSYVNNKTNNAQNLALCDLSYLQRIGFKGAGACDWLKTQNIKIPKDINTALTTADDCIVARLGNNDILILDSIKNQSNVPKTLEQSWQQDYSQSNKPHGFIVPRQDSHACFSISGVCVAEMFSKLCAIDLRMTKFENNMIVQTSMARLGAIIIRHDLNTLTNYLVLVESASVEYLWDCIIDAMQEFDGQIIGTSALLKLT